MVTEESCKAHLLFMSRADRFYANTNPINPQY
ncbi:hypothetical protein GGD50_004432 [Rhizobium paranaense]|uniref:Uncharacterized protein n=1 Tax=Rhizobium paranaense TaxID=1650438 RepID=A0A7W8XUI1_9HYPH|nr:hypothetical protein [Rhizobium paranaense]